MRELKKAVVNVVGAELYALERKTVTGDGPNWVTCVDTYVPYHSKCLVGGTNRVSDAYPGNVEIAKSYSDKEFSALKRCSYHFYIGGVYQGLIPTTYHTSGQCLEKLNGTSN